MTIEEKVLKKGEDDWLYLAEVAGLVRQETPDASDSAVVECTLRILSELAEAGLVVIGDLSDSGCRFAPWQLSIGEAVNRIRIKWGALEAPISLGDVCWISNTPEGDKRASALPNI